MVNMMETKSSLKINSKYVLYNGTAEEEAVKELRLSDAFAKPSPEGKFEWTATLINLNKGKNDELLKKCKPLEDYMFLINAIRENEADGLPIEEAVDKAVRFCIENDVLREYLPDEESIYQKIIENENYKDVLREDVAGSMNK